MTAPTDLLPCPFCGQPATAYRAKPTEYREQMLDDIDTGIACGLRLAADMVRGAVSGGGMDMNCGQRSKHNNTERKA
jgi:hypothetical protein